MTHNPNPLSPKTPPPRIDLAAIKDRRDQFSESLARLQQQHAQTAQQIERHLGAIAVLDDLLSQENEQ